MVAPFLPPPGTLPPGSPPAVPAPAGLPGMPPTMGAPMAPMGPGALGALGPNGPSPMMPPGMMAGAPGAMPMGAPPAAPAAGPTDPLELLAALRELAGSSGQPARTYKAGYKRPAKPTPDRVRQLGDHLDDQGQLWRFMIETTLKWVRQELCGIFPEDREARAQGFQEEFISSVLSDQRNLFVARLASLQLTVKKLYLDENLRREAQMLEDAVAWLRREEEARWVAKGNRPLPLDETTMLTDYGMIACRHVVNTYDPDFPLCLDLIDPKRVNALWGYDGLDLVVCKYRDNASQIAKEYGDFGPTIRKKLENRYGKQGWFDENTELPVYEWWDSWYRCVLVDDQELIPVTPHEYGIVPWTIQYGGLGEPMFTRSGSEQVRQGQNSEWIVSEGWRSDERVNKAVPLVYYGIKQHETFEAVMARMLTAFKKEVDPPFFRKRSMETDGTPMPEVDSGPGKQNELKEGEDVKPWPQLAGGPATQTVLQALAMGRATNAPGPTFYGNVDRSNVTGAAQNAAEDAGEFHFLPLELALKSYHQTKWGNVLYLIREFGDDAKYRAEPPQPLLVPRRRARQGEAPAFELGRDLLERVGTRIEIRLSRVNPRDWVALFNAGQIGVSNNFIEPETIAEMAGVSDYDGMFERLMERKSAVQMFQHPKYLELFEMPATIMEMIRENRGDPERQRWWMQRLQLWEQLIQMETMQQGLTPAGTGGARGGGANGAAPAPGAPPVPGGVSLPPLGLGPGTRGAPVGRPAGPNGTDVGP